MVVFAAGTQVGAGQPLVGQPRTVGAAANGHFHRVHARCCHGLFRPLHHIHARLNALLHIVVAVLEGQLQGSCAVLAVDEVRSGGHNRLLFLELLHVVVADDIVQLGTLHLALHAQQMEEALIALRQLRALSHGEQALEFHGDQLGIHHLPLGRAGVDVQPMHNDLCPCGVEILIFDLPHGAAVGGVGKVRAEALHVKQVGTPADLFVGGKADLQCGVPTVHGEQLLRRRHDLRHACLIVRAQKRRAVCDDQVLACVVFQVRIVRFPQENALFLVQADIPAVISHDLRLDIRAGSVGRGVHVGDQADGWQVRVAGDGAVDIAVFVHPGVRNAHGVHFLHQRGGQRLLFFRGGAGVGFLVRLSVKGHIAQKALYNRFHMVLLPIKIKIGSI